VTRVLWFRRDLRLRDDPALHEAQRGGEEVVPLFVLDGDPQRIVTRWQTVPGRFVVRRACRRDHVQGGHAVPDLHAALPRVGRHGWERDSARRAWDASMRAMPVDRGRRADQRFDPNCAASTPRPSTNRGSSPHRPPATPRRSSTTPPSASKRSTGTTDVDQVLGMETERVPLGFHTENDQVCGFT
jgi:hypothetical protein